MVFVLTAIALMYAGRKLGWAFSTRVLYTKPELLGGILSMLWGGGVALVVRLLIDWQRPNLILKIIFGFMLGAYVSIPNYGLLNDSTVPPEAMSKHRLLSTLPLLAYVITSIVLAWI